MKIPKIPLAQTVIQLCKAKGIKHIVISPGSRSAPLSIGFTHDPFFKCYSIVDERCAAFFALGIAQQIQHPVALVCTSGSALLNYYPAIAEAFYSDIPLVVLSADRPKYLVGIGDGQTINQKEVYGAHVLSSVNLKLDIDKEKKALITSKETPKLLDVIESKLGDYLGMQQSIQQENEQLINKALNTAISLKAPVHINCPFDEPLYEMLNEYTISPRVVDVSYHIDTIEISELEGLQETWNTSKKKMILIGVTAPNTISDALIEAIANDESVIVFTETTSNIHHNKFFHSIDKMLMPLKDDGFKQLQPDLLVTFGGMIVSKKIKAFLRQYQPLQHWHVDPKKANDTFFCLNKHIKTSANYFFKELLYKTVKSDSTYSCEWQKIKVYRQQKHEAYLNEIPYCDFLVFNTILKSIPEFSYLHLGNSSTIRYTQLFKLNKTVKVFCNRGTSGIDGSTSTAIGGSSVLKEQSTFITGDLSFFYDSNALWNNYIPKNFRIIVINNGGGGIFRILPGHKNSKNFDEYFETTHNLTAEQLCNMYNLEYSRALNINDLKRELHQFYADSKSPKLLEVFTPRQINDEVLLNYFKFIK